MIGMTKCTECKHLNDYIKMADTGYCNKKKTFIPLGMQCNQGGKK